MLALFTPKHIPSRVMPGIEFARLSGPKSEGREMRRQCCQLEIRETTSCSSVMVVVSVAYIGRYRRWQTACVWVDASDR